MCTGVCKYVHMYLHVNTEVQKKNIRKSEQKQEQNHSRTKGKVALCTFHTLVLFDFVPLNMYCFSSEIRI